MDYSLLENHYTIDCHLEPEHTAQQHMQCTQPFLFRSSQLPSEPQGDIISAELELCTLHRGTWSACCNHMTQ
jgi:hypothetical protein